MGAAISLIPELEEIVQHGSRQKRVAALQRITALFLDGASRYGDEHVDLFDDVFSLLIEEIETQARAELSSHLAPVENAPARVLRTLARDDDIAVAGPVLKHAPKLAENDLVEVARTKSQAHLQAIATRPALGEAVTDILVRRGDREVAHHVAENRSARISHAGFTRLVRRAEEDGLLAEKVGLRPDIPLPMFQELLARATGVVQKRLLASAAPEVKARVSEVLEKVAKEVGARVGPRDYSAAQRAVLKLDHDGLLNETAVAEFCRDGKFEETAVGLATLTKVPVNVVDRLMSGERPDPILILCKALGFAWTTVRAIIKVRPDAEGTSNYVLDAALSNYDRLSGPTAQRVVRFWQVRQG